MSGRTKIDDIQRPACVHTTGYCRSCAMKARNSSPSFNARLGRLTKEQRELIAATIKQNDRPYVEIAEDWLVSYGTIRSIAREFDIKRPPSVAGRLSKWRHSNPPARAYQAGAM